MRSAFDRIAIAPAVRTAIVAPVDCLRVTVLQEDLTNAAKLWTADAGGLHRTLAPGSERTFQSIEANRGYRKGETVVYIEAAAGVGPVALSFES